MEVGDRSALRASTIHSDHPADMRLCRLAWGALWRRVEIGVEAKC